ncbi:MAG: peptidoglycan DD-metalloendopeptidase family protein [Parvibaculaceae bacterium]|nr:peptidoglycan DD-metalloendopeptidase family protein [Parvibaculaceae bacterium]
MTDSIVSGTATKLAAKSVSIAYQGRHLASCLADDLKTVLASLPQSGRWGMASAVLAGTSALLLSTGLVFMLSASDATVTAKTAPDTSIAPTLISFAPKATKQSMAANAIAGDATKANRSIAPLASLPVIQQSANAVEATAQPTNTFLAETEEERLLATASLAPSDTAASSFEQTGPLETLAPSQVETEQPVFEPERVTKSIEVRSGDTLMSALTRSGATRTDANYAIAAVKPLFDVRKLRAGQKLDLTFEQWPQADESADPVNAQLANISMRTDVDRHIAINRKEDGTYNADEVITELKTGYVRAAGTINSSLFLAADKAGVPASIVVEMIRMYSYDIDFQREMRQGDKFEVFFARDYDDKGTAVRNGDVLYASMTVGGRERELWRFEPDKGGWDYFDKDGQSMKKFLMKTPVDGARISSSFGRRRHPILGYTKMHTGTDFAAPRGTPIYAAGNGIIEKAQRNGGYGKYVKIRHANGYKTAYAHMNGYARGIKKGQRVRQGQVIGYVGTTGRSTGPHLHYEVHVHGKKVNPQSIRIPTGRKLAKAELAHYVTAQRQTNLMMADAPAITKVADASATKTDSSAQ